ncbi:MAG: 30S ribosomal protein S20 [Armatimonadetes bacterium]|nr:30S ribosomal protein S20 [Armatimonadota bacterium]
MANIKSMKKDLRRNAKRRAVTLGVKSSLKTYIRKIKKADSPESAVAAATVAQKALGKAAQRGIIHKNQAARRISRAMKAAKKVEAAK